MKKKDKLNPEEFEEQEHEQVIALRDWKSMVEELNLTKDQEINCLFGFIDEHSLWKELRESMLNSKLERDGLLPWDEEDQALAMASLPVLEGHVEGEE